jgi:hypothetical protein
MRTQDEVAAMSCPVCRVPLSMSDRQGIEIDYCPQCRGVWLDRGELDKIVERSVPQSGGASQDRAPRPAEPRNSGGGQSAWSPGGETHGGYGHGDRSQGGKPYKKRNSWLEDIFD